MMDERRDSGAVVEFIYGSLEVGVDQSFQCFFCRSHGTGSPVTTAPQCKLLFQAPSRCVWTTGPIML